MLLDQTMTIGERFKQIRVEKDFSQSDLAEGICSKTVISHLENDRHYPSASLLGKLAERLGVPMKEIMGMQDTQFAAEFQIDMVKVYIEIDEFTSALSLAETIELREDLLEHQKIKLIMLRSECFLRMKSYEMTVDVLIPFLDTQQETQTKEDEVLCDAYNMLGIAYYWMNNFEKAYSCFEQGYRICLRLPEFGMLGARVTKNLGLTCNQLGFKQDAARYLQKSYAFFEKSSNIVNAGIKLTH